MIDENMYRNNLIGTITMLKTLKQPNDERTGHKTEGQD